ncbi:MAG: MbtH family protein [Leptolyngbyaceae cyanobacterium MAG.088]|nr:MbtH family protein [Leptolyngbyaceae cyanobacterium MAG.088]
MVSPVSKKSTGSTYRVVCNQEEQYSIWPINREIPMGWQDTGKSGNRQECLDHIESVWTDSFPNSEGKRG